MSNKKDSGIFDRKGSIVLILSLFEPTIFYKIPVIHAAYLVLLIISFAFIIMHHIKHRIRLSKLTMAVIIYRLTLLMPTICYSGDYLTWGYLSITTVLLSMIVGIGVKNSKNAFLNKLLTVICLLLLMNLILEVMHPNGLLGYSGLNFLGIRTRITDYAFPAITISAFMLINNKKRKIYYGTLILSFVSIIINSVSTAYVGIAIMIITYILATRRILGIKKIGTALFIISIIISSLIVSFRIGDFFSSSITSLFGKTSSFSGRTELWDSAIKIVKERPLIGYGINNNGNFVPAIVYKGRGDVVALRQAHNQTIQLFHDGGIMAFLAFYYLMYICYKGCDKAKRNKNSILLASSLFALNIMMITEIYSYYVAPYIIMFLCFYADYLLPKQKEPNI
ncbi:O-antigen ligase family protein [Candidatus Saccharibacteria bacterium]|nr:O-antigen ligase family protein [Candidatus Saccharibacteria bacterium]MBR3377770.1 O-antigen ligase family protein [Candidatus Saccharibacteria bacterium]